MKKPKDISSIFKAAMEGPYMGEVARDTLSRGAISDLYATIEKHRLAVGRIFIHPILLPELEAMVQGRELLHWESALPGTKTVIYTGTAWGADFYISYDVPENEIIAVTALRLHMGKYGVAKLTLKQEDKNIMDLENREFLRQLRKSACKAAKKWGRSTSWIKTYEDLARAADILDALWARGYLDGTITTQEDKEVSRTADELRENIQELQKELETREEEELIARGCYRCGGEIDTGAYRRMVQLVGPCSEGSRRETFVLCIECQGKIYDFLNNEEGVKIEVG